MSIFSLLQDCKVTLVEAATAAGTTDVESASVDMSGYRGVLFVTTMGAITTNAVTNMHVEQSADDSSFADLVGTGITIADDDDGQMFGIEIIEPEERYLRCVVDRATQNAVVGEIYAIQFGAQTKPITNTVANTATFESHTRPAEGTI